MMRLKSFTQFVVLVALGAATGCGADFDPYSLVKGFRLLAIGADDPWIGLGQSTVLRALVVSDEPVQYRWSWCPWTTGSLDGFRCAIERDDLQAIVDRELGAGVVTIPSFELGTTETATIVHAVTPALRDAFCKFIETQNIPEFTNPPDCGEAIEVTIRLEVESNGKRIEGIKTMRFVFDTTALNRNPTIRGARIASSDIAGDGSTKVERAAQHPIELDIDPAVSETSVTPPTATATATTEREDLIVTWFIESGAIDKRRTSFIDGDLSFENLGANMWSAPHANDFASDRTRFFFVIRDRRGGVSWLERTIGLVP